MEDESSHSSHLFTLRVWSELMAPGETEWRGKVHHIGSGETRYFRNWDALKEFLIGAMANATDQGGRPHDGG